MIPVDLFCFLFVFSAAAATSCVVLVLLLDAAIDDDGNDFDEEVDEVDEVDEEDAEDAENEDGDADEDAEDTATATASLSSRVLFFFNGEVDVEEDRLRLPICVSFAETGTFLTDDFLTSRLSLFLR